eukprot:Em0004g265a
MSTILKTLCCVRKGTTHELEESLLNPTELKADPTQAKREDNVKLEANPMQAANPTQAQPEPTPGDDNPAALTESMQRCKTVSWIVIKFLVRVLLFSIVVTCTVFSKLSLISLVSRLNETIDDIHRTNDSEATLTPLHDRAAGFFWQLLFIILIPQFVTLFRALLFGVFKSGPWPTLRAILAVSQHCMISCY